jgi:NAD(P)H-dependent FMN reductase
MGHDPAPLKNAIDHLFKEWTRKPAAIVCYGASAAGYRGAEQLRQVPIELKVVPVREQVGIPTVWSAFDEDGKLRNTAFEGAVDTMAVELLWWAAALIPAREGDRQAAAAGA